MQIKASLVLTYSSHGKIKNRKGINMDIKKRIDTLINEINKASYEYYTLDSPSITDQEYDSYMDFLYNFQIFLHYFLL